VTSRLCVRAVDVALSSATGDIFTDCGHFLIFLQIRAGCNYKVLELLLECQNSEILYWNDIILL
jgi:hypothetical protein